MMIARPGLLDGRGHGVLSSRRQVHDSMSARRLFSLLFPAIFIAAGAILVAIYLQQRTRAEESLTWQRVPGVIEKSFLQERLDDVGNDLVITYRYTAGATQFRSNRVAFGSMSNREKQARLERYRAGMPVQVAIDPRDASVALLEPGHRPGESNLLIAGCVLMLLGIGVGRMLWRG
jgi:hypothetical protein